MTRLHRRELRVLRRFERLSRGGTVMAHLRRLLATPAGNFLVNTPLFVLPGQINLQPKHRVLEIGCQSGANLRFLAARFAFQQPPVGVDLDRIALRRGERAHGHLAYALLRATGSRLPVADASFDLVFAAHAIRHLSDEGVMRLLFEAQRVLKPGGLVALWEYAPTSSRRLNRLNARVLRSLGGVGALRGYAKLAHDAAEAGFVVIERPRLRPFFFPPVPRTGLLAKKDG